jgi:signal peptidase I
MILGIFKVSGHSMMPTLKPQDKVIVSSIPFFFSEPKKGDIILFRLNGKPIIKRVKKTSASKIFLEADNESDSLKIEPIKKSEIAGKLIWAL